MQRVHDWQSRLDAYLAEHRGRAFDWAGHNCVSFAAGWVERATGTALELPAAQDVRSALRLVREAGGLAAGAAGRLGEPVGGMFARVGDVVLVRLSPRRRAFGVCIGATVAAPGMKELLMVPITQAEAAWRV